MAADDNALWTAARIVDRLNPVTSGPAAPLVVDAVMDSFGPSLMPRGSLHQGMASGLAATGARAIGLSVDAIAKKVAPASSPLAWRIAARALVMAAGSSLSRIREYPDESTFRASLRSTGRLAAEAALGGIVHEVGEDVQGKFTVPWVPIVTGIGGFGYAASRWARNLELRNSVTQRWTDDDKPANLFSSMAIGTVVSISGRLIGRGFLTARRSLADYMGDTLGKRTVGRAINAGMWGAGVVSGYGVVVSRLSRQNKKVEPAFSATPDNQYVSGGPRSLSPFEELGLHGRRYVSEVVTPDVIEGVLGEKAVNHPIRVYVGVQSEPLYATARSELALLEMDRLGAFDRKYLLLVSPTGTGWVDHTVIESAEILARGDIATACIQYGTAPSFLEVQGVALGGAQFRQLLWGVRQRLISVPEDRRPTVIVFGESLGAWSSSDVVMHQGIAGFDHYGIKRALWFGLPGLARWSRTGMREGRNPLTPEGTVGSFDQFEDFQALTPEEQERLRAIIVDHDNDPIAKLSLRLAVKKPRWLTGERERGVPEAMAWSPVITFIQVLVDAMNATVVVPGEFKSFGHDYRKDTVDFVQAAFGFPDVAEDRVTALRKTLVERELDRGRRIKEGPAPIGSTVQ
ncbi:MAG TPA: alpha/beta-hydrolase family protein [Acidimicrobiia bacterium]|nr:alpha/beta-hydrolase family protein [Acidimicrobiia bacterium]